MPHAGIASAEDDDVVFLSVHKSGLRIPMGESMGAIVVAGASGTGCGIRS
jgi:hypothetical protein